MNIELNREEAIIIYTALQESRAHNYLFIKNNKDTKSAFVLNKVAEANEDLLQICRLITKFFNKMGD